MITRREILAIINATTRVTGYERVLAWDFMDALRSDNIDALDAALLDLAGVALTPWEFALAAHAICGTMIKRHTVGSRAAWSRIPGWALRHKGTPLAALAMAVYLVEEGVYASYDIEVLLACGGWRAWPSDSPQEASGGPQTA